MRVVISELSQSVPVRSVKFGTTPHDEIQSIRPLKLFSALGAPSRLDRLNSYISDGLT